MRKCSNEVTNLQSIYSCSAPLSIISPAGKLGQGQTVLFLVCFFCEVTSLQNNYVYCWHPLFSIKACPLMPRARWEIAERSGEAPAAKAAQPPHLKGTCMPRGAGSPGRVQRGPRKGQPLTGPFCRPPCRRFNVNNQSRQPVFAPPIIPGKPCRSKASPFLEPDNIITVYLSPKTSLTLFVGRCNACCAEAGPD